MPSLGLPLHPEVLIHHDALLRSLWDARDPLIHIGISLGAGGEDDDVRGVLLAVPAGIGTATDEVSSARLPVSGEGKFVTFSLCFRVCAGKHADWLWTSRDE